MPQKIIEKMPQKIIEKSKYSYAGFYCVEKIFRHKILLRCKKSTSENNRMSKYSKIQDFIALQKSASENNRMSKYSYAGFYCVANIWI